MADSKLKIDIRRDRILELLRQSGKVQVSELSKELGATPVTIRNDLDSLERDGYLVRIQGGALLRARSVDSWNGPDQEMVCQAEKRAIARAVAAQIPDGSTLFINSGTTTHCIAEELKECRNINVVTNSLAVAMELGKQPLIHVLLLGGEINAQYGFTYGTDAEAQLHRYQAGWAILSVDGVSARGGVTSFHAEETPIDRMMIERSKHIIIAADHTKINRTGFTRICDIGPEVSLLADQNGTSTAVKLVTDQQCSRDAVAELEALGMEVELA